MSLIRVLLAGDDPLERAAIATRFAQECELEAVGQAAQPGEMLGALDRLQPDVLCLICNTDLPTQATLQTLQTIRAHYSKLGIVALATSELKADMIELFRVGVVGYVLKSDLPEMLVRAVRAVAAGEHWLSPRTIEILLKAAIGIHVRPLGYLTQYDRKVLRLMATGYHNSQIAELLHMNEQALKTHMGFLYNKLRITTRAQAIVYAINQGLVPSHK